MRSHEIDRYYEASNAVQFMLDEHEGLCLPDFTVEVLKQHPIEMAIILSEAPDIEDATILSSAIAPHTAPQVLIHSISAAELFFKDYERAELIKTACEELNYDKIAKLTLLSNADNVRVMSEYLRQIIMDCIEMLDEPGEKMKEKCYPLFENKERTIYFLSRKYVATTLFSYYKIIKEALNGRRNLQYVYDNSPNFKKLIFEIEEANNEYKKELEETRKAARQASKNPTISVSLNDIAPILGVFGSGTALDELSDEDALDMLEAIGKSIKKYVK